MSEGYRLPTAEDDLSAKYGDQGGRALLEGVGRGATLGASDYIQAKGAGIGTSIGNYLADLSGLGETQRATGRGVNAGVEDFDRSDQAAAAEEQARLDLLGRQQANESAATVGELGGAIGLGLLTGGLGTEAAAARLGLSGAEGVLARAGVAGLKGAVEGAAYGAAKAVDDDFLTDHDITAERIMLGAGEGALFGGAFGVGGSLLGSGLKAGSKKVSDLFQGSRKAAQETAEDVAEAAPSRAASAAEVESTLIQQADEASRISSEIGGESAASVDLAFDPVYRMQGALVSSDVAEAEMGRIAKAARQARNAAGGFDEAHQKAVAAAGDAGDDLLKGLDDVDTFADKGAKREWAKRTFTDAVSDDARISTEEALEKFESAIDDIVKEQGSALDFDGGTGTIKKIKRQLDNVRGQLFAKEGAGLGEYASVLDDFKSNMDRIAKNQRNPFLRDVLRGDKRTPGAVDIIRYQLENEAAFGGYAKAQRIVNASWAERIRRQSDQLLRGITYESGEQAADRFELLSKLNRQNLGGLLDSLGGPRYENVKPVEIAFRKFLRAAENDAVTRATMWGDEKLAAQALRLRELRETIESNVSAVALARRDAEAWKQLVEKADVPIPVLGGALRGTMKVAQNIAGRTEAQSSRTTSLMSRASASSAAEGAGETAADVARKKAVSGERLIDKAANAFMAARGVARKVQQKPSAVPLAGVVMFASKPESIQNGIQRLNALKDPMSPERSEVRDRYSSIAVESPEHAAALEKYVQRSAEYMLMKAPQGGIDLSTPFGHTKKPSYSKPQVESFLRSVRAAQNPAAAMERIASGDFSPEDVEAVRTLQPRAWARFVANISAQISRTKNPPSYRDRLRMSKALGIPMTAFETPEFQRLIAESAVIYEQAVQQQQEMERPKYTSATKLANATNNMTTGSERAVTRGQ